MKIGYARVSTDEQNLDLQRAALEAAGCERSLIGERTREGMQAAKGRGKAVGRPRKLTGHQLARARALIETGEETRAGVAELFGVDVATLRRAIGKG